MKIGIIGGTDGLGHTLIYYFKDNIELLDVATPMTLTRYTNVTKGAYMGFLFIGSFIGEVFYKERKSYFKPLPEKPDKNSNKINQVVYYSTIFPYKGIKNVIAFSGRHSLFFYLFHQVLLILILGIVLLSKGYTLNL